MANIRSNSLSSNTLFNTNLLSSDFVYRIQSWQIPGIAVQHQEQATRMGMVNFQGDMINYNPLDLKIIVDEELLNWKEIISVFNKYQIPGTNQCEAKVGDSWVEVYSSKNKYLFKVYFHNCYLKSVGDLQYVTTDDNEIITVDLNLVYDYYTIE